MVEVILPKVDMAMTEGIIASWLRREGETVAAGEPLFEIETDKANVEVESPASGTLWGVRAEPGQTVAVAAVVAYILAAGEQPPAATRSPDGVHAAPAVSSPAQKVRATPLARKISREHGLELASITGSGPQGRIGGQDVLAHVERAQHVATVAPAFEPPVVAAPARDARTVMPVQPAERAPLAEDVTRVPLTPLRKIIADRMRTSVHNAPHFTLNMAIDMTEMVALRGRIAPAIERQAGVKPSFTILLARALAPLLVQHPQLNATWDEDAILLHKRVHLGIALDREGDLLVPVIRDAHTMSIAALAAALRDTAERARQRKLAPDELRGSTFTISNLGMFGVDSFTAIINQPESAILAVGRVVDTPVAQAGALVIRPMMQITLSADHRVVDGATAARFMADLRARLEEPYLLL